MAQNIKKYMMCKIENEYNQSSMAYNIQCHTRYIIYHSYII